MSPRTTLAAAAAALGLASQRAREAGTSPVEARALVREEMLAARREMNTPGGYWVADLSGKGVPHARRATLPASGVVDVVLMSDGFASALDPLALFADGAHLVAGLRQAEPTEAIAEVVNLFDSDPEREKYPRLKHIDDITVLHAAA